MKLPVSVLVVVCELGVKLGAPDPRVRDTAPAPAPAPAINFEEGRKFWSFQPVKDPPAPAVRDGTWPANAIDRFVLAIIRTQITD